MRIANADAPSAVNRPRRTGGVQGAFDVATRWLRYLAVRFCVEGTHRGEFMGVPPTGRAIVLTGQTMMRFRDGRVIERWTTGDLLGLMIQLGAVPAPAG